MLSYAVSPTMLSTGLNGLSLMLPKKFGLARSTAWKFWRASSGVILPIEIGSNVGGLMGGMGPLGGVIFDFLSIGELRQNGYRGTQRWDRLSCRTLFMHALLPGMRCVITRCSSGLQGIVRADEAAFQRVSRNAESMPVNRRETACAKITVLERIEE